MMCRASYAEEEDYHLQSVRGCRHASLLPSPVLPVSLDDPGLECLSVFYRVFLLFVQQTPCSWRSVLASRSELSSLSFFKWINP